MTDFIYFSFYWLSLILLITFLIASLSYLVLIFQSLNVFDNRRDQHFHFKKEKYKPVSLLIPFFNEEKNIIHSTYSFLDQQYPELEIVLINDGSEDKGLEKMIKEFEFELLDRKISRKKGEPKIKGIYRSKKFYYMWLIDKDNGGKSDALNCGISLSSHEYFCAVDGDSILKKNALKRAMNIIIAHPKTAAVGCTVGLVNGCTVERGQVKKFGLPSTLLEKFQYLEYTRSFLIGRNGLEAIHSNLIISGAFGLFKKSLVKSVLGYTVNHLGEDMDLIVKLHKKLRHKKASYEIRFTPEPLCLTEVPYELRSLRRQRIRWQKGFIQSLFTDEQELTFKTSRNLRSYLVVPYFLLMDLIIPVLTLVGYLLFIVGYLFNFISVSHIFIFFGISVFYHTFLSLCALFIAEYNYPHNLKLSQLFNLAWIAFLENFGYRQLISVWRIAAMWQILWTKRNSKQDWGIIERKGF